MPSKVVHPRLERRRSQVPLSRYPREASQAHLSLANCVFIAAAPWLFGKKRRYEPAGIKLKQKTPTLWHMDPQSKFLKNKLTPPPNTSQLTSQHLPVLPARITGFANLLKVNQIFFGTSLHHQGFNGQRYPSHLPLLPWARSFPSDPPAKGMKTWKESMSQGQQLIKMKVSGSWVDLLNVDMFDL